MLKTDFCRSPTGQSPSNKSRKSSTDTIQPPFKDKEKDKKNWKGKMVKQLKKMGGGGHGPMYPEGGSVGVPLDECPLCPASPDSDIPTIPYLIKVSVLRPPYYRHTSYRNVGYKRLEFSSVISRTVAEHL